MRNRVSPGIMSSAFCSPHAKGIPTATPVLGYSGRRRPRPHHCPVARNLPHGPLLVRHRAWSLPGQGTGLHQILSSPCNCPQGHGTRASTARTMGKSPAPVPPSPPSRPCEPQPSGAAPGRPISSPAQPSGSNHKPRTDSRPPRGASMENERPGLNGGRATLITEPDNQTPKGPQ